MKRNYQKPIVVNIGDAVSTLAIRVEPSLCINGIDQTIQRVKTMDPNRYRCIGVIHNPSSRFDKHLHVLVKCIKKARVKRILRDLGISFQDDLVELGTNLQLEMVGDFKEYYRRLTQSKNSGTGLRCVFSDFVSNLSQTEFRRLVGVFQKPSNTRETVQDCVNAHVAGYNLWAYDLWNDLQEATYRGRSEKSLEIKRKHFREGQIERLLTGVPQIAIVINIPMSIPLSVKEVHYISEKALWDIHISTGLASDDTRVDMGCGMIFEQEFNSRISEMDAVTRHAVLSNNFVEKLSSIAPDGTVSIRPRGGLTFKIFISKDLDGDTWFDNDTKKTYYFCKISDDGRKILCKDVCRGGVCELERKDLYIKFSTAFNKQLAKYHKKNKIVSVDYSDILCC